MERLEVERLDLGGYALRCATSGGGGTTFVCLHGLVDTLEIWDRLAPALEARGRLVRIDQRGHGESDTPPGPYAREDLAADVIAVLDRLGGERAVLVGHSMGGIVAMTTALAHPERISGLVLLGTASQCSQRVVDWYERIAVAGEENGLEGIARRIYGKDSDKKIAGDAQGIAHVTRILKSLHEHPLTAQLPKLACPALLLVGEKDPMGLRASEIIEAAIPSGAATFEMIPGRGHWLHVEAPGEVVRALDAWRESLS